MKFKQHYKWLILENGEYMFKMEKVEPYQILDQIEAKIKKDIIR